MKKLLVLLFLMVSAATIQAAEYTEGVHYKKVTPQPTESGDKVEVLEFFWYGCPHCYAFEPDISAWKKTKPTNVVFTRIPAVFRPDWEIQARTYYALKNMGIIEAHHENIFAAIHTNKKRLNKKDDMVAFLVKNGVDKQEFLSEYKSFAVDGMLRKGVKKQTAYHIQGVPSIIVNGKYLTSGSLAGTYANMVKIINHLIALESK